MLIDRLFMLEEKRFIAPMSHRHDVDITKLWPGLAPITVGQNFVTTDLTASLNFTTGGDGPMKEGIETRHPHAARGGLHMLKESRKTPNDFASRQSLCDFAKFFQSDLRFGRAPLPRR